MRLFKKLFRIIHVPEPEVLRNFENVHVIESVATKRFLKKLHLLGEVKTVVAFADWDNFSRLVSEALHTKQSVKSEFSALLRDGEISNGISNGYALWDEIRVSQVPSDGLLG
jgi:hypothetical protein